MINVWGTYHNIENEIIGSSYSISMTEENKNVYSPQICDLILRVASEIEALAKLINKHRKITPKSSPKFDFDILDKLIFLERKAVFLNHYGFFFENNEYYPFSAKNNKGKYDWGVIYQALKHDKYENLQKATIDNLIKIFSALYLLILYAEPYFNISFEKELILPHNPSLNKQTRSMLFSVNMYDLPWAYTKAEIHNNFKDEQYDKAVYIKVVSDRNIENWNHAREETNKIIDSITDADVIRSHPTAPDKSIHPEFFESLRREIAIKKANGNNISPVSIMQKIELRAPLKTTQ